MIFQASEFYEEEKAMEQNVEQRSPKLFGGEF